MRGERFAHCLDVAGPDDAPCEPPFLRSQAATSRVRWELFAVEAEAATPWDNSSGTPRNAETSKSQAIVLGNLALARIHQQKLDEAAAALHSAIDVVEMTWGGGGLNVVFGAGRELRPWRQVPVVQDVYDRLLTLMAAA
ncbi:hypothetical protein [Salinispora arenicola]|uniref:hypothetical protein n=1 Tax=Salinispora arenicola TaxID=168697 RepID=UPI0003767D7B|nr:hypothetical protein [Salinispora arenicola]